jgi:hypothetical protein
MGNDRKTIHSAKDGYVRMYLDGECNLASMDT